MPTLPNEWFIWQGDVFTVKDAVLLNEDQSVFDLTGMSAQLKVWKYNPVSAYFSGIGLTNVSPATQGMVEWVVGSNDGGALPPGSYTAEVQVTDATGYVQSWQIPLVVGANL